MTPAPSRRRTLMRVHQPMGALGLNDPLAFVPMSRRVLALIDSSAASRRIEALDDVKRILESARVAGSRGSPPDGRAHVT